MNSMWIAWVVVTLVAIAFPVLSRGKTGIPNVVVYIWILATTAALGTITL